MLLSDNGKDLSLVKYNSIQRLNKQLNYHNDLSIDDKQHIETLSNDTFSLAENFCQKNKTISNINKKTNKVSGLSDPRLLELELTPTAKIYIKAIFSPFATITYILQKASVAFNKTVAATISFLVFNLVNVFTSSTLGGYEVKLPILTICLVGSILGARDLIKSIKKIILSIPEGIYACSLNIFCNECSIFEFICGTDKTAKQGFFKKHFKI